jgi:hypothetical protein
LGEVGVDRDGGKPGTYEIVSYTMVWKLYYADQRTDTEVTRFNYTDAVAGTADSGGVSLKKRDDRPVLGGEKRVIAREMDIGQTWDEEGYRKQLPSLVADERQELAGVDRIEIGVDAAIFSDGAMVGSNTTGADREFMTYLDAKQKLFREVASDLDSGRGVEEAFAPLKILAARRPDPRDKAEWCETLAAQEVNALRKRRGDSAVGKIVRQQFAKSSS